MKQMHPMLKPIAFAAAIGVLIVLAACAGQAPLSPTTAPATASQPPALAPTIAPTQAVAPVATQAASPVAPTTASGDAAQIILAAPNCSGGVTPEQTEGPYYKANTPERASLVTAGMSGTKITLTGYVLTRNCKPVANAWLDFWQADDKGNYDNSGYTLRGHQTADANGRYTLETIIPGLYPGRTEHIHVKVRAPNQPILTTQLYFPEAAQTNSRDGIYDARLLVTWLTTGKVAVYNFILNVN